MANVENASPYSDPLYRYFDEIKNHKLLSRQQEKMLAMQYVKNQDRAAADRLVRANLRLVVKIAREHHKNKDRYSLNDLIQEGNLGLIQAVEHFNPEKKTKFSYYAAFWIKAYIFKFMMENYRSVKIGTTQAQRRLFFNLRKTRERLLRRGVPVTTRRIAKQLNVKPSEVEEMEKRMDQEDRSLEAPIGARSNEPLVHMLKSEKPSTEDMVANRQMVKMLRSLITRFRSNLTDRETVILEQRIVAEEPLTLQKLGQRFGVSRERIRQIEAKIIRKLKIFLQANIPDFANYAAN